MESATPYSTPELEVRELAPLDSPVHNAAPKSGPPPPEALLLEQTATSPPPLPSPSVVAETPATLSTKQAVAAQNTVSDKDKDKDKDKKEQKPQQLASSPSLLNRKSTMMNTAPRVPSTLRKVVDVRGTEARDGTDEDDDDDASVLRMHHANAAGAAARDEHAVSSKAFPPSTVSLPPLSSRMSSPALRKAYGEPTIMNLVDRSTTGSNKLPHPHDIEPYPLRQRPHSLNTLSSMSCRLSIITVDQDYEEFSYKKNAQQPVHPSMVRGWMRRFRGRVKYSFGQFLASPSLILQGNRDIARGTAQMNLSRQRRHTGLHGSNEGTLSRSLSRRDTSVSTKSADDGGYARSRASRRFSQKANGSSSRRHSGSSVTGSVERVLSVAEMAAAAESAAEIELAEEAASIYSSRMRAREQAQIAAHGHNSLRSSSETTDVSLTDSDAGSPAITSSNRSEGTAVPNSPMTGPALSSSSTDLAKNQSAVLPAPAYPKSNDAASTNNGNVQAARLGRHTDDSRPAAVVC